MRKTYKGKRLPDGETSVIVTVEEDHGTRSYNLAHHVKHSPTGFEWGYPGSGPAELARCILLDYFGGEAVGGEDMADAEGNRYQRFKLARIAVIGSDTWEITSDEIATWIKKDAAVHA